VDQNGINAASYRVISLTAIQQSGYGFLSYDTVYSDRCVPTIQRNSLPPHSTHRRLVRTIVPVLYATGLEYEAALCLHCVMQACACCET